MFEFRIGDVLDLDDGAYQVEGIQGGCLRLSRQHDLQIQIVHVTALSRRLALPPKMDREVPAPDALARLTADELQQVEELSLHVEEVLYGKPLGHDLLRPEYDPATTTQKERVSRKVEELRSQGRQTSVRSIDRYIARYKAGGPAALIDGRAQRAINPLGQLDDRVREALTAVIARATDASTVTVTKLIFDTREEVLRSYPDEGVEMPSERTMRRCVEALTKGKHTAGNAATRRSAANVPKRMFKGRPAFAPGHEVQIDTSPFDVLVFGNDGEPIRAKLTIMLDKATQGIIATSINVEGVKGLDLAFMLAQCLTPRPSRPGGAEAFNELELRQMPWAQALTAEEVEHFDLTRPFIKPQRIMTDNGREYRSSTFISACQRFGIDVTQSATRTPTDKANVERAFHTIKTKFAEHLPGFTGGSVDRRGRNPEKEDLLDIYTLAELFDRWVSVVWQNMQHDALRDPLHPNVIHSPNSMYMAMFDMTGYVPVPLTGEDYVALLPTVERSIQADGIQHDYRRYDSVDLHPYRLQKSPHTRTGSWTIHYNPHNPAAVWVRDPETSVWIECAWMNKDAFERPFSASIRRRAREITAASDTLGDPASMQATIEMIGRTKEAQASKARKDTAQETERRLAEQFDKPIPQPTTIMNTVHDFDDDEDEYDDYGIFDPRKRN